MAKRDQILALFELADRVRQIGADRELVENKNIGAAFSYAEARRHLGALPDRQR